jgi:hypothetical protein
VALLIAALQVESRYIIDKSHVVSGTLDIYNRQPFILSSLLTCVINDLNIYPYP